MEISKVIKGAASQYFVAAELSRRGLVAALTLGNCPNTDILCSDCDATCFAHVQVKTFPLGKKKCAVGPRAEHTYSKRFFWVLVGLPPPESGDPPEYYIIPARDMAHHVKASHGQWQEQHPRSESDVRVVHLPPDKCRDGWQLMKYKGNWAPIMRACLGKRTTGDPTVYLPTRVKARKMP